MWWFTWVLAAEPGFDHSHRALDAVYQGAVQSSAVDYAVLQQRKDALTSYIKQLTDADITGWSQDQQLALWVNAYNALTLDLILTEQPSSIRDLDGGKVWSTRTFRVAGQVLTLDQIEHQRARPLADGRVHAVLNCASKGCPPLPKHPLNATKPLDPQLDAAATHWTQTNAYTLNAGTLQLSQVFNWFSEDFGSGTSDLKKQTQAVAFIQRFTADAVDTALSEATETSWQVYDWSLNGTQ